MNMQKDNNEKKAFTGNKDALWLIILGVLLIFFGTFALFYLGIATLAAVYCFGTLMVVAGVFQIIGAFQVYSGSQKWLWALSGLLYLIAGWLIFSNPFVATTTLTIFLAASLIVGGAFKLVGGFQLKPMTGWGWVVFSGMLTLATGVLILSTPSSAFWVIGMFLGIDMIFQGWSFVTIGLTVKSMKDN